ncbi:DUF3293 domain-containing protein [Celerinatantimonas yamalensis]|uniref:DUF3293 domain-containing protein n=1 Tax=Celerinatantimonas yamalensis TaxID=559956 RepID=A0ABW9G522_9GAMM
MKENYIQHIQPSQPHDEALWQNYQQLDLIAKQPICWPAGIIITAANPYGQIVARRLNHHRHLALMRLLGQLRWPYQLVWGCALDDSHGELSCYCPVVEIKGRRLAQRMRQLSIYNVDAHSLSLVDCVGQRACIALGNVQNFWQVQPVRYVRLARKF